MDKNSMDYKGEVIQLDKERHIKYTIKGLKMISAKFGSVVDAFDKMQNMNTNFDTETMDNLVLLLHAGLIHEDNELTADYIENYVTLENMTTIFGTIIKAFGGSMPEGDEVSESTEEKQI